MRNVEAQGAKSRKRAFLRYEQRQRKAPKKADGRAREVRRLGAGGWRGWAGYRSGSKGGLITKVGAASQVSVSSHWDLEHEVATIQL